MIELTEAQQAAMETAYNEWYDQDEGEVVRGAFGRGYASGFAAAGADLLAACRAVIDACRSEDTCDNGFIERYADNSAYTYDQRPCPHCTAARAAIARAEGTDPR